MKKQIAGLEISAVAVLMMAAVFWGPWWLLIVPITAFGYYRGRAKRLLRWSFTAGATAWILPALLQDLTIGFRLSKRIAGVAGLQWGFFAYLIIGLVSGLLSVLGASTGSNFRAVQEMIARRRADQRVEDARAG